MAVSESIIALDHLKPLVTIIEVRKMALGQPMMNLDIIRHKE